MNDPQEIRYPYVHVDVRADQADETVALLFELGATGVEERDDTTLARATAKGAVTLVASFDTHDEAAEAAASIDPALAPRIEEIVGDAWRDAWKEHFRPFAIAEGIVIRPPWERYEAKPHERVLTLEPGRAFGTGLHETTRLVAEALAAHRDVLREGAVLDVGTGSGILALIALTLGAARAVAIDNDPEAIDVARENAEANAMTASIAASTTALEEIAEEFPVVVANIEARVLVPMSGALRARVAPGGLLVLSGILATQEAEVAAAYAEMDRIATPQRGEWIALLLRDRAAR